MKTTITPDIVSAMILGSSIYSTGGGFEYSVQLKLFKELFNKYPTLSLISIDELDDEDYICTAYGVGSAGNTDFDLSKPLQKGLQTLEKFTGKKFKAIFAGETNIDVLAFQAASNMGLPVLDADSNGGRAVPEIQFDNFVITQKNIPPVVAVTLEGEVAILAQSKDGTTIEKFVRSLSANSETGVVAVLDHPIQVKDAKSVLTLGIFERSIRLGQLIESSKKDETLLPKIIEEIGGKLLIKGTVTSTEKEDSHSEGFLKGFYTVSDNEGDTLKVFLKNENIMCWLNGKVALTTPDCILTIDTKTFEGAHNSKIYEGQEIAVIAKPATDLWRTPEGIALFSPKHFGFDDPTTLVK